MATDVQSPLDREPLRIGEYALEVAIVRIRSRSNDARSTWGVAETRYRGEDLVVVGHDVGGYRPGDRLRVIGRYETHATYGEQFRVRHAVRLDTPDADGILALCQLCPHIGEARARALLDELGIDEFLDAVDDDPQAVFGALPGMNPERAHAAARAWEGLRGQRDLIATLAPLGLAHLAPQVTRWFTDRATEVIHDAPYELIRVPGFGFERADAVANRVGITDPGARARAAVLHLLEEAEKRGETFLPRELLGRKLHTLLGDEANLEAGLSEPTLILEGDAVYRRHTHRAERQVAGDLRELARSKPRLQVGGVPASLGFTDEQQEAVERTFTSRLSVITGGPGVGKTATVRAIVATARGAGLRVALCAPSAMAADVLRRATGHPAATIHRTLRWGRGGPAHSHGNPIPADLVVVDEASMLSLDLARVLLPAIAEDAHLVLVGDALQLGPVDPGEPFLDLCEASICPVTWLRTVFRQRPQHPGERPNSMIVAAAHAVREGRWPRERPRPDERLDFFFHRQDDPVQAANDVVRIVGDRIPAAFGLDPRRDVQVLAPMASGPIGTKNLNARLREALNPDGERCCEGRFRVGDRLVQTHNDYDHGLFNGTRCVLEERLPEIPALHLRTDVGEEIRLPYPQTAHLELGYALTVHKAEGSETPAAVVVCHSDHQYMLDIRVLNTAISRPKRVCVVVGDERGLQIARSRLNALPRHSRLCERLSGA